MNKKELGIDDGSIKTDTGASCPVNADKRHSFRPSKGCTWKCACGTTFTACLGVAGGKRGKHCLEDSHCKVTQ